MTPAEKLQSLARIELTKEQVFHIDLRDSWGSENPNYRQEIRRGILEYLKLNFPDQVEDSIWDLDAPPVLKKFFVSISHTQGLGGFALCSRPLGLDIETTARITQKVVERVSSESELKACPEPQLLWTAKESIFKCSSEFYTINHIQVENWSKSHFETHAFTSLTATGWAFTDSNHSYALAIKKD